MITVRIVVYDYIFFGFFQELTVALFLPFVDFP